MTATELQAQIYTRRMHKKVCSDQGRRSGNRHVDTCCRLWRSSGHDRQHFHEHCFYRFVAVERRFQDASVSAKDLRRKNVSIVLQTSLGQSYVVGFTWEVANADILWQAMFLPFVDVTFVVGKGKQSRPLPKKRNAVSGQSLTWWCIRIIMLSDR